MTKKFCDLCGKPANDKRLWNRTSHPKLNWTGSRSTPGSPNMCDGTFKPMMDTSIRFKGHSFKDVQDGTCPDMCLSCQVELAQHLLTKITEELKGTAV